ncbi:hypothetical protein CCAX7_000070 [Capsulimonas corticalis]|uniref:CBM-cenC domain-containing protein n=1 Tax=Capsulimonas corticalis TaxID=2219043 RepID=A0A9N7QBA9_9BACT|nr:hypothetical protein CCAX7_000070 [Capsulimonas corticalis]
MCAAFFATGAASATALAAAPSVTAPNWIKMPLLSPAGKKAGVFPGGEGAQWPRNPIAVSPADPNFLLLPIDVGGLYRSMDGGKTWNIAMVGWDARGANAFAIDPKNAKHVLGVGSNSMNWQDGWGPSPNGLYLSKDKAASWKHVLARDEGVTGAVAWDPSSYDKAKGECTRAYYNGYGIGLHRSDDGGETWREVSAPNVTAPARDWTQGPNGTGLLRVDAQGGIYTVGAEGAFRSTDGGKTFAHIRKGEVDGLDITSDGAIVICSSQGVFISHDRGDSFTMLAGKGLEARGSGSINGIVVSPADPKRMICWLVPISPYTKPDFDWPRYVSWDGGATWTRARTDNTLAELPPNGRQGYTTWSPKDPNVAWGIGGDWATISTDGGKSFRWSNNGYNGVMLGATFNFSPHAPGTVFLGFQDYNGAFTKDGGATWNYRDVSGKGWGGHEYAALAVDESLMISGDADSWGTPRQLHVSRDGGTTFTTIKGADGKPMEFHGSDVTFADPADGNVCFASDIRSADHGATWARMDGCDGVFTANPVTNVLYGRKGESVVRSSDHGATWTKVADIAGGLVDLALDHKTGRIYAASQDRLKVYDGTGWTTLETPKDQYGHERVWTVAVDPQQPSVVYVGAPQNTYASAATVCRSTDGGKTWRNLTVTTPLPAGASGGPHEVSCIRVNPKTREAWLNGECYGMWRIAPPAPGAQGVSAALASAPAIVAAPKSTDAPMHSLAVSNGGMESGTNAPEGWAVTWTGSGSLALARDTSEHHAGAASLRLASVGGAAKGQVSQILEAAPDMTFTVSGWVKSQGGATVNVAVQPMNAAWTPIAFFQTGYVQGDAGWTYFEKKVTLPKDTARFGLVLLLDGQGTAWLDDVSVEAL